MTKLEKAHAVLMRCYVDVMNDDFYVQDAREMLVVNAETLVGRPTGAQAKPHVKIYWLLYAVIEGGSAGVYELIRPWTLYYQSGNLPKDGLDLKAVILWLSRIDNWTKDEFFQLYRPTNEADTRWLYTAMAAYLEFTDDPPEPIQQKPNQGDIVDRQ